MDATLVFVSGAVYMAVWLIREYQWSKEREKLLDRIMARSLPEFKHEVRKEEILKKRDTAVAKPSPSDEELAAWELKHSSQVAENNAAIDAALAALRVKAAAAAEIHKPAGVSHGS